jgi:hypothetical protein
MDDNSSQVRCSHTIDAFQGQHTIALECAGRERNEKQRCRRDQSDRSGAPVRPVSLGLPNSGVWEGNYHIYVMDDI